MSELEILKEYNNVRNISVNNDRIMLDCNTPESVEQDNFIVLLHKKNDFNTDHFGMHLTRIENIDFIDLGNYINDLNNLITMVWFKDACTIYVVKYKNQVYLLDDKEFNFGF